VSRGELKVKTNFLSLFISPCAWPFLRISARKRMEGEHKDKIREKVKNKEKQGKKLPDKRLSGRERNAL
jgi:hypothetical protein